jgi:hypothetical protein
MTLGGTQPFLDEAPSKLARALKGTSLKGACVLSCVAKKNEERKENTP